MRDLNLTVVAARHGATSRAYLSYLRDAGYRPAKVLVVDFIGQDARYARLQRWLGNRVAWHMVQGRRTNPPQASEKFRALCDLLQKDAPRPIDYFGGFDFTMHAREVQSVVALNFEDPGLHRCLRRQDCRVFLYTEGGRVPGALLEDPDLAFLHIHPGVLPYVRGSDGLLWSIAVRGCPGATCFYMNAGIDTGAIIQTREFERPAFPGIAAASTDDLPLVYRALLHAYDPHLRAQLLLDVVRSSADGDLAKLPSRKQTPSEGSNYYWMHPRLQKRVIEALDA